MHTVFALLCFVVVIHWLIFPYPSGLLHWHCGKYNDCPSASKATPMNMDKYFMWIHYERLHNHNKAKHNKTMCIFLGIYCTCAQRVSESSWWHLQILTLPDLIGWYDCYMRGHVVSCKWRQICFYLFLVNRFGDCVTVRWHISLHKWWFRYVYNANECHVYKIEMNVNTMSLAFISFCFVTNLESHLKKLLCHVTPLLKFGE